MSELFFIHFLLGPFFLVLAIIFRVYTPTSINGTYGYRTRYSMKSQEVWEEGNRYSSNLMIGVGIVVTIAQVIFYFTLSASNQILVATLLLVVLLIAIIPITEAHLRKNFDEEGKYKI